MDKISDKHSADEPRAAQAMSLWEKVTLKMNEKTKAELIPRYLESELVSG